MKRIAAISFIWFLSFGFIQAQNDQNHTHSQNHAHTHGHDHEHNLKIYFPDIPGFYTLTTDFHMHTVFSDGSVWPDIRVEEALREGLDVVAFTEHIEYQPHSEDIPHPDRNRSYEVAKKAAEGSGLMIINGSEITRSMPPGHSNAVFVKDANKLIAEDAMDAFEEANRQGAFVFWNHPHWTAQRKDGIARLDDMHKELIEKGLMHGIEVVNVETYSDEALQIALDYGLTIMGTSDIHGLTDWDFNIPHGGHRSITLVFAKEKSEASVKEALFEGRTVVWFKNSFIGLEEYLIPLIQSSLHFKAVGYQNDSSVLEITITNPTHSEFIFENEGDFNFHEDPSVITIEPNSTRTLLLKTKDRLKDVDLTFKVINAYTAPETHPLVHYKILVSQ